MKRKSNVVLDLGRQVEVELLTQEQAAEIRRRSCEGLTAIAIREKALVPDHPDVAENLGNMTALYRAMKRDKEAEPLKRRAEHGRTAR